MSKVNSICQSCGKAFLAKQSDINRGWAKCCSKSCAASKRERDLDRFGYRNKLHRPINAVGGVLTDEDQP